MTFDDESREWLELRGGQKLRVLLPPGVLGLSAGILAVGVITLFLVPRDQLNLFTGLLVLCFSLGASMILALAWAATRLPAILRSTERSKTVIARPRSE